MNDCEESEWHDVPVKCQVRDTGEGSTWSTIVGVLYKVDCPESRNVANEQQVQYKDDYR